jgi:TonB family protein
MIDLRLIAMPLTVFTMSAIAEDLNFHSELTDGSPPAIRITVTDKSDPANGSQSSLTRETGKCQVLMWVTSDGYVRAAQVAASSGFLALDAACLSTLIGHRMSPSRSVDGRPIDQWVEIPIIWVAKGSLAAKPAKPPDRPDVPIALLIPNQTLPLKPADYPRGAFVRREQGKCVVHVDLSPSGKVLAFSVTQHTGSAELDAACLNVLHVAQFVPPTLNQKWAQARMWR